MRKVSIEFFEQFEQYVNNKVEEIVVHCIKGPIKRLDQRVAYMEGRASLVDEMSIEIGNLKERIDELEE